VWDPVLLDREELRRGEALPDKDPGFDDSRDASVATAEGVDRDRVQVGHRRPHDEVDVGLAATPISDSTTLSISLTTSRRPDPRTPSPVARGDADRSGPPQTRILIALEGAGVEVEIEDHPVRPGEDRIDRHRADVG
jgi:hypothetical protein